MNSDRSMFGSAGEQRSVRNLLALGVSVTSEGASGPHVMRAQCMLWWQPGVCDNSHGHDVSY